MKTWLKIISAALVVVLIVGAVWCFSQERKDCCLCSSFRYHAPCLVDLQTGDLLELDLYLPHPTKVAELAEFQPQTSTFSFVRFGDVSGIKQTCPEIIEITGPSSEKAATPVLCGACRIRTGSLLPPRYVLADLYDANHKSVIPLHPGLSMQLRCYKIFVEKKDGSSLNVTIQGLLPAR